MIVIEHLKEKLKHLPEEPGIYMMKNIKGEIIYVGKAKAIRKRVRSYFSGISSKDIKTQTLVREINDVDVIYTKTEEEALLLERTLIRHHNPRYNVFLKDGKEYPYIRIQFKDDWPRIEKVRQRKKDEAFYLGPFSHAGYLNTSLKLLGRIFPLIRCSRHEFKNAKRPCNYYHMSMCLGPCVLPVERDDYISMIRDAISFLTGKNKELKTQIKQKMMGASEKQDYELAAKYRDQLLALDEVAKRQSVVVKGTVDADVIGIHKRDNQTAFHILLVREGRIIGGENFLVPSPIQGEGETLRSFLIQYYDNQFLPKELIVSTKFDSMEELLPLLGPQSLEKPSYRVEVKTPQRGSRKDLLDMAQKNARYHFEEASRQRKSTKVELELLQEMLAMTDPPNRIECIDISNFQGTANVASLVCFIDGKPAKHLYRHYAIKDLPPGKQNDFASITEVVSRRLKRGLEEGNLPGLLVIDGGKGQLSAAIKATRDHPNASLKVISLAKARVDKNQDDKSGRVRRSYERIFVDNEENAIPLKPGSAVYRILTHIRDEAHRFAITHHRKKRSNKFKNSALDEIPGVGTTIRQRLLEHFKGLEGIKKASLDELKRIKGVKESVAVAIHSKFND